MIINRVSGRRQREPNIPRSGSSIVVVVEKKIEYTTQAWAVVPPGKTALVVWKVWKKSDDCPREREREKMDETVQKVREENREREREKVEGRKKRREERIEEGKKEREKWKWKQTEWIENEWIRYKQKKQKNQTRSWRSSSFETGGRILIGWKASGSAGCDGVVTANGINIPRQQPMGVGVQQAHPWSCSSKFSRPGGERGWNGILARSILLLL